MSFQNTNESIQNYHRIHYYDSIIIEPTFLECLYEPNVFDNLVSALKKFKKNLIIPEKFLIENENKKNIDSNGLKRKEIGKAQFNKIAHSREIILAVSDYQSDSSQDLIIRMLSEFKGKFEILVLTNDSEFSNRIIRLPKAGVLNKNLHVCYLSKTGKLKDHGIQLQQSTDFPSFRYNPKLAPIVQGKCVVTKIPKMGDYVYIDGIKFQLGHEIDSGGEGSLYQLDKRHVIKIYHQEMLTETRINKLNLMISHPMDHNQIIWPKEAVLNKNKVIVGFVMRKVDGYLLNEFFGGKNEVLRLFPHWKRSDVVRLAITFLDHISYLHQKNILIGDIKPDNFIFKSQKDIFFIDTDGYQIENYPSVVGDPYFTPPEMMNLKFEDKLRTFGSEYFSVATMIFKILMLGQNTYLRSMDSENLSVSERVIQMRFPFSLSKSESKKNAPTGMWSYIWSHMPFFLKKDFIETFDYSGTKNTESTRYNIAEWKAKLEEYEKLLKSGIMTKEDPMSNDLIPTRNKQSSRSKFK